MAKDKKRNIDENEKSETMFYYEIIGIIFIILTFIILGKLGQVGLVLTSFFKVLFGDLYWFFLLFMLLYGILSLLRHKAFDFKNQRFIGYIFFSLGLLMFAHFPVHNYVIKENDSGYLSSVWSIYKVYLDTSIETYLGGGLIGALLFFLVYFLFGKFGVIIIASLIMILGFSLIINRSLIEILKFVFNKLKNVKSGVKNFNSFFKYEIGKKSIIPKVTNIFDKNYQVNLSVFESFNNTINYNSQDKLALEIKSTINSIFNSMNLEYREINYIVTFQVTSFNYFIYSPYEYQKILTKLSNILDDEVAVGCDNTAIIIQVVNRYQSLLTIKELLSKQESLYNNFIIPLGIKHNREILDQDFLKNQHLLVVGSYASGVRNFISYIVASLLVKNKTKDYEISIFDNLEEFSYLYPLYNDPKEYNAITYLELLSKEVETRLELLSSNHVLTIAEYNKKQMLSNSNNLIKRKFVIINHFEETKENYAFFENKLMYITQLGEKCGINVIYIIREYRYLSNIILSLFPAKVLFKTDDNKISKAIVGNDNGNYLLKNGDCYYSFKGKSKRMQSALITKKELSNIKKELGIKINS